MNRKRKADRLTEKERQTTDRKRMTGRQTGRENDRQTDRKRE